MNTNLQSLTDAAALRSRAEERVKARKGASQAGSREPQLEVDLARLVHELQVHQVELEMQNEELMQSRAQTETLLAQYTDLYNFAPAGYLTCDHDGVIRQANLTAATLLGIERSRLLNKRFALFVAAEARSAFDALLTRAFESKGMEVCEVRLSLESKPPLTVQLQACVSEDRQECRVVLTDITERKRMEAALQQRAEDLRARNEELTRFNRAGIGREMRMIELKQEVNELCQQLGQPVRYPLEFLEAQPIKDRDSAFVETAGDEHGKPATEA